jgi:hypothetical protein
VKNSDYEEIYRRASENIFEVYIMPGIERRQKDGDLEAPVELFAANLGSTETMLISRRNTCAS